MSDILDKARAAIRLAETDPDAAAREMAALERRAAPDERFMFGMLWEGLFVAAHSVPPDDGTDHKPGGR